MTFYDRRSCFDIGSWKVVRCSLFEWGSMALSLDFRLAWMRITIPDIAVV